MDFFKLYTDGSYQPEAEIAGMGGHLLNPQGETVFEFSEQIHQASDFRFHESLALIQGLKKCLSLGIEYLECFSDDISMRNLFNKEYLSDISTATNPHRKEIFLLKQEFKVIQFHHLPRKFNKIADKLAGKILRIHKEDILPSRTRADFIGQEDKFLNLPNLICSEDYIGDSEQIKNEIKDISHSILMHIYKNDITVDNIDDNNSLTINTYFIHHNENSIADVRLFTSSIIIQKKLISTGLEILLDAFNHYSEHCNIGLMFSYIERPLNKLDMLLRKRGILPLPNTPLTKRFLESSKLFNKIVLENNANIIHQVLHEKTNKILNSLKTYKTII